MPPSELCIVCRNLEDIVRAGRASGGPILLSTVAVNLKDCPPFGSTPARALSDTDREAQDRLCAEAAQAEARGDFAGAATKLEAAARVDPTPAELQFRWGEGLLGLQSTVHSP